MLFYSFCQHHIQKRILCEQSVNGIARSSAYMNDTTEHWFVLFLCFPQACMAERKEAIYVRRGPPQTPHINIKTCGTFKMSVCWSSVCILYNVRLFVTVNGPS